MAETNQLAIPDAARKDPKAFELLRVWIANGDQHVSLRAGVWADPAAWGIMLADLAKHVTKSYEQDEGRDSIKTFQRIKDALNAELASQTDKPSGQISR